MPESVSPAEGQCPTPDLRPRQSESPDDPKRFNPCDDYLEFLRSKAVAASEQGLEISRGDIHHSLFDFQKDIVQWAVRGGRRAIFGSFGLGKTRMQLEAVRLVIENEGGPGLLVAPLGVRQEFKREAQALGSSIRFIRSFDEVGTGLYLTNYETIREGKLDPTRFTAVSLDEAAILRGFGGTKTFREFMRYFEGSGIRYRFVATATPDPNEFIELLAYAAFLEIMDVGQAKTRFFKRDSTKADKLTLHPHKESEFWHWVASWGLFIQRPSDLGYSDEGYDLPPLDVRWHEIPSDHSDAGTERSGQARMFRDASLGVVQASREKRDSLPGRLEKAKEIIAESPDDHFLIWHDLEAERHAIEQEIEEVVSVYGSQDHDDREQVLVDFSDGKIKRLAAKPSIAGAGCNFQRYCHRAIYLGISFKFYEFIQAVYRIQRFLQPHTCRLDLIHTEAERGVREILERKWGQHTEKVKRMSEIIRRHGLSGAAISGALKRKMGVDRTEVKGKRFTAVNNDCVLETRRIEDNSVGLILTSIPFSTQYEYSPNFADFGHTDDNDHFFEQMDYLTPELLRVLMPGRIAAIHVKDRVVPGGMTGLGFQTVYPFHAECIRHYTKHGFAYMGMKTIVTDVVRENNQTYRLGWTEQCKDGTKMGCGMPEYLLLFRKPPTDNSNSYADLPVVKDKAKYSRARWQIDAHGFTRSNGNRLLSREDLEGLRHEQIFKLFRNYYRAHVYDYENHVKLGEALEEKEVLPVTFMLLQPPSWHPNVWTDITRMRTLNTSQHQKGKQFHLCPMQIDLADRVIEQLSMKDEVVYDPFGGLGTVAVRSVRLGRYGYTVELSSDYHRDAVAYLEAEERKVSMPSLFDLEALQTQENAS